ncbi:S1 RNA-binding domain-containing protein [Elizabethkingia meningoseptica]|uniref:S1 RNA-binding domain-containing protein n=1 Tax=Elizabethkingia meningoseptica TaxID=238 RepID=UPI0023B067DA|nr:S1 RNA-binding domain-containing protein [Elizabethkingia meningoseptica]MDE5492237.1 S1 RNA-binding domain-containing protein [Elizabethkingia meningoseptica]
MNELLKTILVYGVTPLLIVFAYIYLLGEVWSKGKIILADIAAFFGWAGKGVRKFSVQQEYQGTINSIIHDYNQNFENPILPKCKIEWVTAENQRNILKEDEAIVCLSFDKKDHNLNFYNATLNFVQTALIAKAKDYLNKPSSKAIDLLTTHVILRNNRKEVLTTFRKKLNEFDAETKVEFETLVPTNDRGLFLNILLPEFHFYGELIDSLPPSSEYNIEANRLLDWFKELATREFDDKTNLKFISKNLKVGVILVGKDETWESQGTEAYTKWADYYATENYNSVYVLARGSNGYERATAVTKILTNSKGFDQVNKNPKIKCVSAEGQEYIVTCYSLRPNKATIAYLAWENFKEHNANGNLVPAIVDSVQKEIIVVNVFGLKFELANNLLSDNEIFDARKVFKVEDELYLAITEFDNDKQLITLSNKGTVSDPKHFIEAVLNTDKVYLCKVEKIQVDKQGLQTGLKVSTLELNHWIYIPKSKATPSRFLDLTTKFSIGAELNVIIDNYTSSSSNFVGHLEAFTDPWESSTLKKLQPHDILSVTVKQINEFSVICEIEEGLECRFSKQEISWNNEECNTSNFKVDDKVEVTIVAIDSDKKRIDVSIKRLSKTPELEYFDTNYNKVVDIEITKIVSEGIVVKYLDNTNTGFIPWFEIGYGSVGRFETIYKEGDKIRAVVSEFDAEKNSLKFSIKKQFPHQFDNWVTAINYDIPIEGKVIGYFENSAHIELKQNNFTLQAFILRKFVSKHAFVESDDLSYYLPIGEIFNFNILEINEDRQTISLTRVEYLDKLEKPNYGEKVQVKYVKENHSKGYFYSDKLEGWTVIPENNIILGSIIEVIPISHSNGEYQIL